ncbi:hypothetical protein J5Y03_08810 [Bacillus sp. RG28]|uniref:Netrin module non-TIMP type domain-containing protein n=1 Tax=Gottfriedia endophytica TaxID=2820819 RepID=A0A940NH34_9BACI|nr:hypothetical protein [Gottfriedia endophytica]MBP0725289.1 hypothetical protein [Gottfriedia endophytica]
MKKISIFILLVSFALGLFVFKPSTTFACSCVKPQGVKEELTRSDQVFSGKVLSIKNEKGSKVILFKVNQTWKGSKVTKIKITTGLGGGDCGYPFQKNHDYLVYANKSDMYGKKELVSVICSRTNDLASAKEDLAKLGKGLK